ncbi:MAG: ATP-binding protein [Planctomycetota bacterium]|nr:ATP-binding protein [Planctomycetota bacterium]
MMEAAVPLSGRRDSVIEYLTNESDTPATDTALREAVGAVRLRRVFTDRRQESLEPSEAVIREILLRVNKHTPEDEFNCGACGYETCREKARAVHQGLAEAEMCLPYLVGQLEKMQADLQTSLSKLAQSYSELSHAHDELAGAHRAIEAAQQQLIQSEKLAAMGQLAASVAHEINNPMTGILTYTRLMKSMLSEICAQPGEPPQEKCADVDRSPVLNDKFPKFLGLMEREISRCSSTVRHLLDFAKQSEPRLQLIDIVGSLENALALLEHQMVLQDIKVEKLYEKVPGIMGDFTQLRQVFVNLILNASQAMTTGGRLILESRPLADRQQVEIRISDTGHGIAPENLGKLFVPFFTTKKKGTGLGLSVAYGIISRHGGSIEVASAVGKGSTFTLRFPAHGG